MKKVTALESIFLVIGSALLATIPYVFMTVVSDLFHINMSLLESVTWVVLFVLLFIASIAVKINTAKNSTESEEKEKSNNEVAVIVISVLVISGIMAAFLMYMISKVIDATRLPM